MLFLSNNGSQSLSLAQSLTLSVLIDHEPSNSQISSSGARVDKKEFRLDQDTDRQRDRRTDR